MNLTGGLIALSQLKKVVSGLTFDKKNNEKLPVIHERFKREDLLKQGYKEMASLNLNHIYNKF